MNEPSMQQLAARLARGEEAAFAELYDTCADKLHHYLTAQIGSRDAASDVLQTAFLRAVRNRRRFRGVENPVAYLFQIARNEAVRWAKRRRVNDRPLTAVDIFAVNSDGFGQHDDAEVVATALTRLTAEDRELVELKVFAGLTLREIAGVTGLPPGTVATRFRRAIESLRPWVVKQLR
jgi:RNA polymerase sigma-70 factor (ECF subfamily)